MSKKIKEIYKIVFFNTRFYEFIIIVAASSFNQMELGNRIGLFKYVTYIYIMLLIYRLPSFFIEDKSCCGIIPLQIKEVVCKYSLYVMPKLHIPLIDYFIFLLSCSFFFRLATTIYNPIWLCFFYDNNGNRLIILNIPPFLKRFWIIIELFLWMFIFIFHIIYVLVPSFIKFFNKDKYKLIIVSFSELKLKSLLIKQYNPILLLSSIIQLIFCILLIFITHICLQNINIHNNNLFFIRFIIYTILWSFFIFIDLYLLYIYTKKIFTIRASVLSS